MSIVSATITAANQFTPFLQLGPAPLSYFSLRWRGLASTTTMVIQWKRPGEADSAAVNGRTFTVNNSSVDGVEWGRMSGPWELRAGVPTGFFGSGTLEVDLFRDS